MKTIDKLIQKAYKFRHNEAPGIFFVSYDDELKLYKLDIRYYADIPGKERQKIYYYRTEDEAMAVCNELIQEYNAEGTPIIIDDISSPALGLCGDDYAGTPQAT